MLAYCTAVDLPSGMLVYAAGEGELGTYKVKYAGKTIEVVSVDLEGTPEAILGDVGHLSQRVRDRTLASWALPAV